MAELIANRYANALFELALENNKIDAYYNDVLLIYNSVKDNSDFLTVLNHPQISGEEKLDVLVKTFEDKVNPDVIGLFSVAFRKNREAELLDILFAFIEMVKKHKGIVTATVTSAKELSNEQLEQIRLKLSTNLNKQVIVEPEVDPRLIGGLKIKVCGHLIDNTVKKHLDDLKEQLDKTRLAQ